MHEAGLIAGLMRRITDIASAEGARRVTAVSVWLGALSHLSAEHFTRHFEQASAGTVAEGAKLAVTVSHDLNDVRAQDLVLESVELES